MRTEEIRYESGDEIYAVVMTEATGRIAMERMATVRKALAENDAARDDPDKVALADRHLVYAALRLVIVSACKTDTKGTILATFSIPLSFDAFLDLPQQLTDVALAAANRRLNPQWFAADATEAPTGEDLKKAA